MHKLCTVHNFLKKKKGTLFLAGFYQIYCVFHDDRDIYIAKSIRWTESCLTSKMWIRKHYTEFALVLFAQEEALLHYAFCEKHYSYNFICIEYIVIKLQFDVNHKNVQVGPIFA